MTVIDEIAAERKRQIEVEGFDAEHDHLEAGHGELALVAACYASPGLKKASGSDVPICWPPTWDEKWWKPKDRRRDLIRAGALLVAEIERLDRLEPAHD